MPVPRDMPDNMIDAYTLNRQIPVYHYFCNEGDYAGPQVDWTDDIIQYWINLFSLENIRSGVTNGKTYIGAGEYHLEAFEKYMDVIKNKKVAVIGSSNPWIEAILVNCGAKEVVTVEYIVPICNHDIIKTISYTDFCNSSEKYDAVVSYSSIEHSGLGRYGDPLNPNGDIETMEQIYKSLNDGGLCFLGIPVGKDYLVWNAHRIYGEKRLKLMYLDKFKEIEWIGMDKNFIHTCPQPIGEPSWREQPIIILQKPV